MKWGNYIIYTNPCHSFSCKKNLIIINIQKFFLFLFSNTAIPVPTIYPPILRITSADGTQISLAWKRNPNDSNQDPSLPSSSSSLNLPEITAYELRYISNDLEQRQNYSTILISKDQTETTLTGLKPQTEYSFQVFSHFCFRNCSNPIRVFDSRFLKKEKQKVSPYL